MFNCQKCYSTSKPGEKQNKALVEVRKKQYFLMERVVDSQGNESFNPKLQGEGLEIVKEIAVCGSCFKG